MPDSPKLYFSCHSPPDFPAQIKDALPRLGIGNSPFSNLDWFEMLRCHGLPLDISPTYLLASSPEGPVACLPVLRVVQGASPKRLEALSNYYNPLFSPVLTPNSEQAAAAALHHFLSGPAKNTDIVDLHPMDANSRFFHEAEATLKRKAYWTDRYFCFGNWYLEVAGRDYEQYFRDLPTKIRKNAPRERRRLVEKGMVIHLYTQHDAELEQGIRAYDQVYAGSWKKPEPYPEFIPELCRLAARQGWLRLGIMTLGEEKIPVAAQLWLVQGRTAYIYKVAYVEQYAKQSVGTVLTCEMMRHVIDTDKVTQVDYGMGDDPYKQEWMSHRRERFGLVAFNLRRPLGLLAASRHFGGKLLRPLRRHLQPSATKDTSPPSK